MELQRMRTGDIAELAPVLESEGGVIVEGFIPPAVIDRMNREFDPFVDKARGRTTGSPLYDVFHGSETVVMHGLLAKAPSFEEVLIQPLALAFAEAQFQGRCASIALASAEFRQVGPGSPAQRPHRDDGSWSYARDFPGPLMVSTLLALTPFTAETGATRVWPGSHLWPRDRAVQETDPLALALMAPGDAIFFRGDLFHGAGPNLTGQVRRRGIVTSYCLGWLRPVENSILNLPPAQARSFSPRTQALLGYALHDATASPTHRGGVLGFYENGDPAQLLV
jgi:hypothetical protein